VGYNWEVTYELAKQLKEAGFPQADGVKRHVAPSVCSIHEIPRGHEYCKECGFVYVPTLNELIDACGISFGSLQARHELAEQKWLAINEDIEADCFGIGSTPTEAVARLYIALHANGDASA
jgi:hypothetical protein